MTDKSNDTLEVRLLDTADLRAMLGIKSRGSMYDLIFKGIIPPPFKLGGRNRWKANEVVKLIEDLASRPSTELTSN